MGGEKKKGGEGQLHLAHPSGTVLPHKKSLELGRRRGGRLGLQKRCEVVGGRTFGEEG